MWSFFEPGDISQQLRLLLKHTSSLQYEHKFHLATICEHALEISCSKHKVAQPRLLEFTEP